MTDIGIRDISVSFRDNKISNISLVQGDALTRGFDINFVNAKGEILPVDDDYVVELIAVNSKDKDTPYACRHEIVDDKYRVMIPPEALSQSGSVTIQLVFYQKSTKAVIHTIKQKCPVYQSIGQEFVESNNLYVDITALRLGLEKIEKLDGKYEEIIEKDIEIQANETERKEAEGKRNLNEAIRKDNESIRNSNEEKREQLKTALIELKNSIENDLESINLTVDDIISSEDDRKQNEIIREEIKVELENLVADIQNKLDNGDFVGEKGEQGIQGEQGPQGPPGEVTQEQLENFKDANSLKIAKLEKELQNYKSTMANINVNQEVKQSVSGYGVVSLPKNASNGQVRASVKGLTATNLTKNGVGHWDTVGVNTQKETTTTLSGEAIKIIATASTVSSSRISSKDMIYINTGDKIYYRFYAYGEKVFRPNFRGSDFDGSVSVPTIPNEWTKVEGFVTANNTIDAPALIYPANSVFGDAVLMEQGDYLIVDNIVVLNLTQLGLENKTVEEMEKMFPSYFDSTKSTVSASRLKSVDKDGIQESTQYLPNVGELRSLPNGVRDEIKVSSGKGEHIKRVSDTMEELAEPITTPIEVSGNLISYPSGTVYVEKVLPVAGIYTDEITIAHTDFPISSLDKISKIDFATGVETQLDVSKAVVATDKLSFTDTDLTSGDIVFFEYFYANESTQGELELEYYDSRHVLKDSVTGKFYKIIPTVANGVLTNGLLEV